MIQSDCVHSYGESTVIVEPTCVKVGKSHRFCSLCGNELFEVIPETEHSYDASGDLNGDFGVDIVDAVRIKKHLSSADITSMLTYSVIGAVVAYRCRFFRQKLIFK